MAFNVTISTALNFAMRTAEYFIRRVVDDCAIRTEGTEDKARKICLFVTFHSKLGEATPSEFQIEFAASHKLGSFSNQETFVFHLQ